MKMGDNIMGKRKTKKRKKLLITIYPSGSEGRGKGHRKIVTSILTPRQYRNRFYASSYHFNTEYAIKVEYL